MRILNIQNLHLSHNSFDISINDLNLESDVWYSETSINLSFFMNFKNDERFIETSFTITITNFYLNCLSKASVISIQFE